jgi:hypothetical protein
MDPELDDFFPRLAALDIEDRYQPGAVAQVFDASDRQATTPLQIRDNSGVPFENNVLVASEKAMYPEFLAPEGVFHVIVKSGDKVTDHVSLYGLVRAAGLGPERVTAAIDSAGLAEERAQRAEQAAADADAAAAVLRELADAQGAQVAEDPNEPGLFNILNPAAIAEDPNEPGTFTIGATS